MGMLILAQNLFITWFANVSLPSIKTLWPLSVCKPYWYLWKTTPTHLNLKYSNLTLDHPLTFNGKPQTKCIDSFCILNHVLKPRPSTYLPLCSIHVCSYVCITWLLYCLLIAMCLYCIDWTERYDLRWKECVSNDKFQKASDTPA